MMFKVKIRLQSYGGIYLCAILILGLTPWIVEAADLPVIPGASGWGIHTPAGRHGAIYKVINLNASGPGSLRAAVEAEGRKVVVFEVSGTIDLSKNIKVSSPYITIAGQTAPSPGITLRGAGITIATHDVLVQHLRIRVGDDPHGHDPENRDGISLDAYSQSVHNVVIDHCSVSWAVDGNIDLWNTPLHDVTIRYSLISEGLHYSIHPETIQTKEGHSTGLLIGDGAQKVTIHANLFAHNSDRSPRQKQDTTSEIVNNVIYNWSWFGLRTDAPANIIGNYFKTGPDTLPGAKGIYVHFRKEATSAQQHTIYVADNLGPGRPNNTLDDWSAVDGDPGYRAKTPYVQTSGIMAMDPDAAYSHVLAKAGARPNDRDSVDIRIVDNVLHGDGSIIDSPKEVKGWPALAKNVRTLVLPGNPDDDDDQDGYTNLEEWLHDMAADVETTSGETGRPAPPSQLTLSPMSLN